MPRVVNSSLNQSYLVGLSNSNGVNSPGSTSSHEVISIDGIRGAESSSNGALSSGLLSGRKSSVPSLTSRKTMYGASSRRIKSEPDIEIDKGGDNGTPTPSKQAIESLPLPPPPPPSPSTTRNVGSHYTSKRKQRAAESGSSTLLPITSGRVGRSTSLSASTRSTNAITTSHERRRQLRAAVRGKNFLLPSDNSSDPGDMSPLQHSPLQRRKETVRAAVSGSGSLLPVLGDNYSDARARPGSSPMLRGWGSRRGTEDSTGSVRAMRKRTKPKLEDNYHSGDESVSSIVRMPRRPSFDNSISPYQPPAKPHSHKFYLQKLMTMKLGNFLRLVAIVLFVVLVWDAHRKASATSQRLQLFKSEESVVMLHLHRLEKQLIFLHENLERLSKKGKEAPAPGEANPKKPGIDIALINQQKQQLFQMEEELNHEVRTLQMQMQKSARRSIVQEYGEGPIQVRLDLQFSGDSRPGSATNQIGILLWHDTPHAAWTLLEQITRHVWDGASFKLDNSRILGCDPVHGDSSKLEFVEQSERGHKAWTVGLMESNNGALRFFINLQDNTSFSKYNVCVGKVINGFDALQRLVESSRNVENGVQPVTIISARATHLARRDTDSLYT